MKICVFCSANAGLAPACQRAAGELGRWIGSGGHSLVFGGTDLGLMETVARAAREAGGRVVGVVPERVEERGHTSRLLDVHIPCADLTDRKQLMMAQGDAFVALPGGIGTLDEVFTVAAAASIGYHKKRVILYNVDGFWRSLLAMLDDLKAKGVMRRGLDDSLVAADTLDDVVRLLGGDGQ